MLYVHLLLLSINTLLACSAVSIAIAAIIIIVRPYKAKYKIYNTSDALPMLVLAVFPLVLLESVLYSNVKQLSNGVTIYSSVSVLLILFHFQKHRGIESNVLVACFNGPKTSCACGGLKE